MMKRKVEEVLGEKITHYVSQSKKIILIDWKDINDGSLCIHQASPVYVPGTDREVRGVTIFNENESFVAVDAFMENALKYSKKTRAKQCECVVYPENADLDGWTLFVEMKYANGISQAVDSRNDYPNTALKQIKSSVKFFRDKGIIAMDKIVHAVISFPNLLFPFNSFILSPQQITEISKTDKIIIRSTNSVRVDSDKELILL